MRHKHGQLTSLPSMRTTRSPEKNFNNYFVWKHHIEAKIPYTPQIPHSGCPSPHALRSRWQGLLRVGFPTGLWGVPLALSVSLRHLYPKWIEMGKPHRSSYIIIAFHFAACHFSLSLAFCWANNFFLSSSLGRFLFPSMMIGHPCLATMPRDCRGCFSFLHLHYVCPSRLAFSQSFSKSYLWSPWQLLKYF